MLVKVYSPVHLKTIMEKYYRVKTDEDPKLKSGASVCTMG